MSELLGRIAVALMGRIDYGSIRAQGLSAEDIIKLPASDLALLGNYDNAHTAATERESAMSKARAEAEFAQRRNLRVLTPLEEDYPVRLRGTKHEPRLITICGNATLNPLRSIAIVGTRRATPYGISAVNSIVADLAVISNPVTVISGLAYGIDATAHKAALKEGLPTLAVVAHGLGMIYPAAHRGLAYDIVAAGGAIISTYLHDTKPYRSFFLARNAVIAALSDATLVAESDLRGGAMSTAAHAASCDRAVLALPGRITDSSSSGCNHLIRSGKATLINSAGDIAETMQWADKDNDKRPEPSLFPRLSPDQELVVTLLREADMPLTIDEITRRSGMPVHKVMAAIAELEFEGLLLRWPGARFQCNY